MSLDYKQEVDKTQLRATKTQKQNPVSKSDPRYEKRDSSAQRSQKQPERWPEANELHTSEASEAAPRNCSPFSSLDTGNKATGRHSECASSYKSGTPACSSASF